MSPTQIDRLPETTCRLLDRLDRPDLRSEAIARHLAHWREIPRSSREVLIQTFDDPGELRPMLMDEARGALEAAIVVLPRHHGRRLANLVAALDRRVIECTSPKHILSDPNYAYPPHPRWWMLRSGL